MEQQKCTPGAVCTEDVCVQTYPSLGMVYIPCQQFRMLYDDCTALHRGTIFRELDKPFGRGMKFGQNMMPMQRAQAWNNAGGGGRR